MFRVTTQQELNDILSRDSADLEELGIDTYEDPRIHLDGAAFTIDCQQELFFSYTDVKFIGNGYDKTTITLMNAEMDTFDTIDENLPIFDYTSNVSFQKVFLKSNDLMVIRFNMEEDMEQWQQFSLDPATIKIVNEDAIHDEFMEWFESIDVEGEIRAGDHLIVDRGFYTHHGIYIGNNKIIHYSGEPGTNGKICETTLKRFALGDPFWVYEHNKGFLKHEIVERAHSRLGENKYDVLFNNCEHFCHWCSTGEHRSNQVIGVFIMGLSGLRLAKVVNQGTKVLRLS